MNLKTDDREAHVNYGRPLTRKFGKEFGPNTLCPLHSEEAGKPVKAKRCGCWQAMKDEPYFTPEETEVEQCQKTDPFYGKNQ